MIETRALLSQIMFKCWTSVMRFRFVALDLILMVEDVLPLHQDKNNASFSVINVGRLSFMLFRFVALDLILMVEDVLPLHQDKNNASFSVITDGRVYELMARDEDEKER